MRGDFGSLWVWKESRVRDRLGWYYSVATNDMPAKYLICKRVPVDPSIYGMDMDGLWREYDTVLERFLSLWDDVRSKRVKIKDIPIAETNLLDLLLAIVKRSLHACNFCRWNCGVDRLAGGKLGACKLEAESRVSTFFHHRGEEIVFRGSKGSGTIFFTSCNMRCSFCIHPNTFILTADGPITVKDLFSKAGFELAHNGCLIRFPEGLSVYSHDGRLVKAAKIYKHEHRGDMILIEPLYAPPLLVTPEHELLVCDTPSSRPRRMMARDISTKHFLLIPIPKPPVTEMDSLDVASIVAPLAEASYYMTNAKHRLVYIQQAVRLSYNGIPSRQIAETLGYHPAYVRSLLSRIRCNGIPSWRRNNSIVIEDGRVRLRTEKRPGIPARLQMSEELAELLGYYCADGRVSRAIRRPSSYCTVFSFGRHEMHLAERVRALIEEIFGLEARIVERRTTITVEIGKSSLGLLLKRLCGGSAHTKRVPEFLFRAASKIKETFLTALVRGDGSITRGYISINTVSKQLAMGVYMLYLQLGHLPSYNVYEPRKSKLIEGRDVKQSTLYYVKVRLNRFNGRSWRRARHVRYDICDGYIEVPVYRVDKVQYSGPVYNLEVDDPEHTYVANCLAVGNCQNGDISTDRFNGSVVTPYMIALMAYKLRLEGCHNINWVGGEPTIHLHSIVEAIYEMSRFTTSSNRVRSEEIFMIRGINADMPYEYAISSSNAYHADEFNTPQLWNSNFFMSKEALNILRCIMDVWLPDLKFGSNKCSLRLARTPWYWETVTSNIKQVHEWQEDMVIRHLIMPGHVECCTKPVLEWVTDNMPNTLINIMDQYRPENYCDPYSPKYDPAYKDMARFPTQQEIDEAYRYARSLGLNFEIITFEKRIR